MVLNGNGTPVWYQELTAAAGGAINVQPLPDDEISWSPSLGPGIGAGLNGDAYTGFDLDTQSTIAPLPAATSPTDIHELLPLPNGDRMMISTPIISKNLTGLGTGVIGNSGTQTPASAADNNVIDCMVEEVNPQNTAAWTWDAAQHIGLDEANTVSGLPNPGLPWVLDTINSTNAADIYHCNSVAVDEDSSSPYFGDVLVSMRHLNAVLLIDKTTGDVIWKMGGTALNSGDPEEGQTTPAQYLAITGDSETKFCGQHDARFVATPNPAVEDVSVYDDHSGCDGAARGVEYAIDTTAGTATPDYQYAQQQGLSVSATGSFRRMPDAANDVGSGTSLIGWGISVPSFLSGFTEVDSSGNVLVDVRFPNGEVLYRAIKVLAGDVNLNLLRQTAGWTGSTIPPPPASPTVTSVVPTSGPSGGNTRVTISGTGFTDTRAVWFGGQQTQAFTVQSDSQITAQVPPGPLGTVDVRVTTDAGTSAASSSDAYTYGAETQQPSVVGVARTPDGRGYWVVAADGRVYNYGDARYFGSAYGLALEGSDRRHRRDPLRQRVLARGVRRRGLRLRRRAVPRIGRRSDAQQAGRRDGRHAERPRLLARRVRRRDLQLRRCAVRGFDRRLAPQQAGGRDVTDAEWPRLLARRVRRRSVQLWRRVVPRVRRRYGAEQAGGRDGTDSERLGLLAGRVGWRHLQLRRCAVRGLDGQLDPEPAGGGDGGDVERPRLLVGRVGRRRLRLRRRPVRRVRSRRLSLRPPP